MNRETSLPLTTLVSVSSEWQSKQSEVLIARDEDTAVRSTMVTINALGIDLSPLNAPGKPFRRRRASYDKVFFFTSILRKKEEK